MKSERLFMLPKGQVFIPRQFRLDLGLKEGSEFRVSAIRRDGRKLLIFEFLESYNEDEIVEMTDKLLESSRKNFSEDELMRQLALEIKKDRKKAKKTKGSF